jgi:uncharacterized protein (DUF58 family)
MPAQPERDQADIDLDGQIRRLQMHSRHAVETLLAGEYKSVFKGRGIEFEDVREYQAGDDVRTIDWNVTARTGRPFIKQYIEERELNIYILMDVSASFHYGSIEKAKRDAAAELAALLAFSAAANNDRVGLILFTDRIESFVRPSKGRQHTMRILDALLSCRPESGQTDISQALDFLNNVTSKRAIIFLFSDFLSPDFKEALQTTSRHHEVVTITVSDRHEAELPNVGLLELRDSESGLHRVVDTSRPGIRHSFEDAFKSHHRHAAELFQELDIDHLHVFTHDDYVEDLVGLFHERKLKRRHAAG